MYNDCQKKKKIIIHLIHPYFSLDGGYSEALVIKVNGTSFLWLILM